MAKTKKISKKRIAFISVFSVLLSAILFAGCYISVCLIKTRYINLKTDTQVYADAEIINADISYLMKDRHIFKKISRLGYNKDATIKVVLKDSLQDFQKEIIRNAYENIINPLFAVINDKYVFEVMNAADFKKTSADTVIIYFEHDKGLDDIWGAEGRTNYHFINSFINPIFYQITITLSNTIGEDCIIHEILHTFGLDDVVNTENYGTFLKYRAEHISKYKPNDIRALAALYYQGQDFDGLKQWLDDYTSNYYEKLSEHFADGSLWDYATIGDGWVAQPIENKIIAIEPFGNKRIYSGDNETFSLRFEITLENGVFHFIQKNTQTEEIIFESTGTYYHFNGIIYLGVLHTPIQDKVIKHDVIIVNTENGLMLCSIKEYLNNYFNSPGVTAKESEKIYLANRE